MMNEVVGLQRVNVTAIRKELHELWKSESLSDKSTTIKAQTHNLIVYVRDNSKLNDLTQRIIELTSVRPGRVIVLFRADADDELTSWISAYCRQIEQRQVCGELVMLQVGDGIRDGIHTDVIGLLVPDLPVYLLWMDMPDLQDELFVRLADEANRILVDTHETTNIVDLLPKLAILSDHYNLGDLNWVRLNMWRRLLHQIWGAPDLKGRLSELQSLDIHFNTSTDFANSARALLLTGWLASCLEWTLVRATAGKMGGYSTVWHRYDEFGWDGKVELVESKHTDLATGEIVGVFVQAGNKPPYVMPRIQINGKRGLVELRIDDSSPASSRREMPFSTISAAHALAEELDLSYDPLYKNALMVAANIVNQAHESNS